MEHLKDRSVDPRGKICSHCYWPTSIIEGKRSFQISLLPMPLGKRE